MSAATGHVAVTRPDDNALMLPPVPVVGDVQASAGDEAPKGRDFPLFNRELSLLAFNRRVLALAQDPAVPLLERLRFLCIASTNLDEFFEIRVAGLKQRLELATAPVGLDDLPASEALHAIAEEARDIVNQQYQMLNEDLIPALEKEAIRVLKRSEWSTGSEAWLRKYFEEEVQPVLSPMGLDP